MKENCSRPKGNGKDIQKGQNCGGKVVKYIKMLKEVARRKFPEKRRGHPTPAPSSAHFPPSSKRSTSPF
jgi:hypothetical protein